MRHVILILMIALLPLRSWVGDAMAMDTATRPITAAATAVSIAQAVEATPAAAAAMPLDCPMHRQAADARAQVGQESTAAAQPTPVEAACTHCDSCDLCLPLFAASPVQAPAGQSPSETVGPQSASSFTSAERVPGFKPPIS